MDIIDYFMDEPGRLGNDFFSEFKFNEFWFSADFFADIEKFQGKAFLFHSIKRKVHGKRAGSESGIPPFGLFPTDVFENENVELRRKMIFLKIGKEHRRIKKTEFRMMPVYKSFRADDTFIVKRDFRLIGNGKITSAEGNFSLADKFPFFLGRNFYGIFEKFKNIVVFGIVKDCGGFFHHG